MANSGSSDNTPPWVIEHALNQIGKHPHVDTVGPVEISPDGIYVASVPIRTNLPTAWRAAGKSPTGVQLVEQAVFQFPPDYPANPPRIYLRNDFNRSLPHIQPGDLEDPVEPCYLDGDPRELLYRQGIGAIVNQLVYWLERAAKDELIDREQGWEPIRRDSIDDYAVVEHSSLRQLVKRVFGLVIDFGTSQSPKSTLPLTTYLCPSRPGHPALRNNFASSLLLRTWLPMTGRRVRRPTLLALPQMEWVDYRNPL